MFIQSRSSAECAHGILHDSALVRKPNLPGSVNIFSDFTINTQTVCVILCAAFLFVIQKVGRKTGVAYSKSHNYFNTIAMNGIKQRVLPSTKVSPCGGVSKYPQ